MDMVRCMMAQASLPISFWGDALLTAAYLLNRVPSKSVELTPYELWTGSSPLWGISDLGGAQLMYTLLLIHMGSWALGPKSVYSCDIQRGSKDTFSYERTMMELGLS